MTTLIVVPMRADSQGIPGKHLKLLGGLPVAQRVLTMLQTVEDARLLVSTNDPAVRRLAQTLNVECIVRPANLCEADVTLDPVAHHAWLVGGKPDVLVTVQATAPFLQAGTVRAAIAAVRVAEYDTATVVVDDRHLRWEGNIPPARVNRQQMAPAWRETAAVCATRAEFITPTSRFGPRVQLIEVSGAEAVDLDTPEDWAVAEWYAGVPSNRECLMARVLGDRYPAEGLIIKLSAWDEESDDTTFRDATLARLRGLPGENRITLCPMDANTYVEASGCGESMAVFGDVLLLTSAYHQPRAFLTFLRVLQERHLDRQVRLWNVPAASRMDKLAAEWAKILQYQQRGHVASIEDGLTYLAWRDQQHTRLQQSPSMMLTQA